jgi:hypothetical protein
MMFSHAQTFASFSLALVVACSSPPQPSLKPTAAATSESASKSTASSDATAATAEKESSPSPSADSASRQGSAITLVSLLDELTDRQAIARWPSPAYVCAQASSYDRASVSPDKDWFANGDAGQYIRMETRDGRTEGVMLDTDGPGAIVRIWSANPAGNLRVYIDGTDKPAIEDDMGAILGGKSSVKPPLAAVTSNGYSLYAPIPYAKHCKVTCDKPKDVYYHVNYRTYERATTVASFDKNAFLQQAAALDAANSRLTNSGPVEAMKPEASSPTERHNPLIRGTSRTIQATPPHSAGPGAICQVAVRIEAEELPEALRNLVLHMSFDGEESIVCPVGDFFGSGPGIRPETSWPFSMSWKEAPGVQDNFDIADLYSRWIMPYARDFEISFEHNGRSEVRTQVRLKQTDWTWDDHSMHFHARWRGEHALKTRPMRDWNHITIEGQGVFVGDALSIGNPTTAWWGEGDEKFYVDGEKFPSHFGTGTEDYYGYAWSSPELFQHPLHNQTRCDGPNVFGWTSVNRFRALDAIPFTRSLRFDMEIWHWRDCEIERAATVYYYARPGAKDNAPPIRAADLEIKQYEFKPFMIDGALEAESARVVASSPGLESEPQDMDGEQWSGAKHLWVRAKEKGQFIELAFPVAEPGRHEVIVYPTRSWDYGTIQFFVDGKKAGDPLVTFNTERRDVGVPKPYSLGTFDLGSEMKLRVEAVGTHEKSEAPHYYFGIDCVVIK